MAKDLEAPRGFCAFLDSAPAGSLKALLALGVAVNLTDEVAVKLITDCAPDGFEPIDFVGVVKTCDFVISRNSEWYLEREVRFWLAANLAKYEDSVFVTTCHEILKNIMFSSKLEQAGKTVPAYLFTPAGRAYHEVPFSHTLGLEFYKEASREIARY